MNILRRLKQWWSAPPPPGRPVPDWGRKGIQPKGKIGPPPRPNGRVVATKPAAPVASIVLVVFDGRLHFRQYENGVCIKTGEVDPA